MEVLGVLRQSKPWAAGFQGSLLNYLGDVQEGYAVAVVYVLANQKGGVGKTTSTYNLGVALAELRQPPCGFGSAGRVNLLRWIRTRGSPAHCIPLPASRYPVTDVVLRMTMASIY